MGACKFWTADTDGVQMLPRVIKPQHGDDGSAYRAVRSAFEQVYRLPRRYGLKARVWPLAQAALRALRSGEYAGKMFRIEVGHGNHRDLRASIRTDCSMTAAWLMPRSVDNRSMSLSASSDSRKLVDFFIIRIVARYALRCQAL